MKKISYVLLIIVTFFTVINVNAMTESELKTKLTKTYIINGEEIKVSDSQRTEIERYLDKYEISSSDADYISGKVDEAIAIAQKAKATNFTDLTSSEVSQIIALVSDISKNTSVKASLTNDGKLTIYEEDGKTPFTIITDKDNGIKNTNNNYFIIIIAGAISLLGIVVITKKVATTNA